MQMTREHVRMFGSTHITTLIFDCDGVLAGTPSEMASLPAFRQTVEEFGLPALRSEWTLAWPSRWGWQGSSSGGAC